MNRRENPRIEIKLPCHVTSPSIWLKSPMFTENISRSGVMVAWQGQTESPMPVPGQVLTIEVELPAAHGFGQKCIHCQGTVIRVSDAGRAPAGGAAGQLYGFPFLPRSDSQRAFAAAGHKFLDGVDRYGSHQITLRD